MTADEGTRWAPQMKDTVAALVDEIVHLYAKGRTILAVDGTDAAAASHFAETLAEAIRGKGLEVERASLHDSDDTGFRHEVLQPFRAGEEPDAMLIVDGTRLHLAERRGIWHFSIWLDGPGDDPEYRRTVGPGPLASAILDNSDPEHPRRVFADSC